MKKYISLTILSCILASFCSCSDYLDVDHYFKDRLNLDSVFAKKHTSDRWLAQVYGYLRNQNGEVVSKGNTVFNYISDDMFYGDRDNRCKIFTNGEYSEGDQQHWGNRYEAIRQATIYINNIDRNREMTQSEIARGKGEARFLRAYFYWMLIRQYGPVPLIGEEVQDYSQTYGELAISRNSYDECVDYITSEFAKAAIDLPIYLGSHELARASKGSALAARAKVFLFAASPLFNGNNELHDLRDDKGRELITKEYDEAKWAKAAAAAKEVIDMQRYKLYTTPVRTTDREGVPKTLIPPIHPIYSTKNFPEGWADIDPYESYRRIFNGYIKLSEIDEIIFTRIQTDDGGHENIVSMVLHQVPRTLGGWNTHGISQKQADIYHMNDGTNLPSPRPTGFSTDANSHLPLPANVSLQYANREPRFYASIAYNGSIWYNLSAKKTEEHNRQIFYYFGEANGKNPAEPAFHVRTGIGIKKFYHPNDSWSEGGRVEPKPEPAIRYAEILLIYAEALNELTKSHTVKSHDGRRDIVVNRNVSEIIKSFSQIRIRGGIPDLESHIYNNVAAFRTALKRERQIELFAEQHRYWDLRRWKDAPKEEGMQMEGCNMNMTRDQREVFHSPVVISSVPRIFLPKMYLWPIGKDELRRNPKLTQNPGWSK